jgi:hypothetical protein
VIRTRKKFHNSCWDYVSVPKNAGCIVSSIYKYCTGATINPMPLLFWLSGHCGFFPVVLAFRSFQLSTFALTIPRSFQSQQTKEFETRRSAPQQSENGKRNLYKNCTFKRQITLDRPGPRPFPNICHLPDPHPFSFPSVPDPVQDPHVFGLPDPDPSIILLSSSKNSMKNLDS